MKITNGLQQIQHDQIPTQFKSSRFNSDRTQNLFHIFISPQKIIQSRARDSETMNPFRTQADT